MTPLGKIIKDYAIPVVVVAVNGALAVITGLWIFALAAGVIAVLVALKIRHGLRSPDTQD